MADRFAVGELLTAPDSQSAVVALDRAGLATLRAGLFAAEALGLLFQ
jgi:hypothetical protein